jgi:exonuclease SbcC
MEAQLTDLVITNIRSIRGTVAIPLDAPIVLIHGLNGMGKTSILSALELALTGDIAHLQRADMAYRKHLLNWDTGEGSIDLISLGDQFPNGRGEIKLVITADGASHGSLLDDEHAKFFSERCYLPQATLNRLLEIYQNATANGKTSPLTRFVKDLLGLDQLDALVDGLAAAFHVARVRNLVPEYRRFENLQSELGEEARSAHMREREAKEAIRTQRQILAGKLTSLYEPQSPLHSLLDKPEELQRALNRDTSDQADLSRLVEARQEIASLSKRWADLSTSPVAVERKAKEAEEREARQAYNRWTKRSGQQLITIIADLSDLFPDLSSPLESDPESARADAETRVIKERERCNRILQRAAEATARLAQIDTRIQRSRARMIELDQELPTLSQDAESLARVLATIVPHIHGDECPVCKRNFSELKKRPLSAQVSASIAALTSQAGRLKILAQNRAEEAGQLAGAERERLSAQKEQLAPEDISNLTLRRARMEEAAAKLASLTGPAREGAGISRRQVAARESLAVLRRRDEIATEIRNEVAQWTPSILQQSIDDFEATDEALSYLSEALERRVSAAQVREEVRRSILSELALYVEKLRSSARNEQLRLRNDRQLSALREKANAVDALRATAKVISTAATNARNNIVGRVFNTSLNRIWRDLFVRLAPHEQFVPRFKLPTADDPDIEAFLETIHRDGRRAGPPATMLSAANLNTAALTLFLALHLSIKTRLPWLILDDPVQSMDDVHITQFAALLRMLARTRARQIILAVHDRALFDYLSLELSPAFQDDRLITVEVSRTVTGDTIAIPKVLTFTPDKAIAA